ncbi:undecaprenyl-diphosphatase [Meinhardsimonia xiamenensis]|jgi:undecaprenyl-diphosphatase|uniref:Undecaprenyl-diphosphatase n=1 Tax=Meinhardsimonia xiamenensis TaxID=990712 RepID=A0A1G8Z3V7_9RHOB|nr:undecaprenyl-diphosphate phosphatase [Meinhardsimonia xiamenensis]PRX37545.1 undecaprenyl-diphosphatase [Meinhardsimonia xiamenensis]SDK09802.1 undecaprenyl-diphosphatase [Meinhardsimonia xiamenensis]
MPILHLLLVATIQGITEFLPISSSGHLILLPQLTGAADQGLAVDVAVHVGTLLAVILYFWRDVRLAAGGLPALLAGRVGEPGALLALLLVIATVPVVLAGALLELAGLTAALRSVAVIGWTTLIFGLLLWWADRTGQQVKRSEEWCLRDAVVMGLWQALALIPGTSRSGVTITAARRLGYARHDAARLSMLMSIPTILASGALLGAEVALSGDPGRLSDMVIGAAFAFAAALLALSLMMRLLRSLSFTPYVIYRVGLGLVLLWVAYG